MLNRNQQNTILKIYLLNTTVLIQKKCKKIKMKKKIKNKILQNYLYPNLYKKINFLYKTFKVQKLKKKMTKN